MSIESWADVARQGQYHQSAEHQRAIDTIQAVLEGNLESDSAASTLASTYEPLLKRGFKTSPVATLWGIICDVARSLGANREITERQIALLNSISKLPDVLDGQGKAITPAWKSAGVYWRDLPELATMFREYAIGKLRTLSSGTGLVGPFVADQYGCVKQILNPWTNWTKTNGILRQRLYSMPPPSAPCISSSGSKT